MSDGPLLPDLRRRCRDGAGVMTTVEADGVMLGVEHFGDAAAPLVLLTGGPTMLSWPDTLCEALARGIEARGDPSFFEITEARPALAGRQRVGRVTDLVWSPRLERNIGYVWVPAELAGPGNDLEVEWNSGERAPAKTAAIPFLDPHKKVPAASPALSLPPVRRAAGAYSR